MATISVKIRVIPFAVASAAAAFLWWTKPAQSSFNPWFADWLGERITESDQNKPQQRGGFWANISGTLTRFRDTTVAKIIQSVSEIHHSDMLFFRFARVHLDTKVLTFIGICGSWNNITPPDSVK